MVFSHVFFILHYFHDRVYSIQYTVYLVGGGVMTGEEFSAFRSERVEGRRAIGLFLVCGRYSCGWPRKPSPKSILYLAIRSTNGVRGRSPCKSACRRVRAYSPPLYLCVFYFCSKCAVETVVETDQRGYAGARSCTLGARHFHASVAFFFVKMSKDFFLSRRC